MLGLYFCKGPVQNFSDAKTSNLERFAEYYRGMRDKGIYLAPSQFEALFISSAHDAAAIDQTIAAAQEVFNSLS